MSSETQSQEMTIVLSKPFYKVLCDFYKSKNQQYYLTREQIGTALEYSNPQVAIGKIHDRNADRLDKFSTLTTLVNVEGTRKVSRETIVYTLKGIMEICRFSRQPKADEFMDFVWDIMESLFNKESKLVPTSANPLLEQSIMSLQQSQQNLINCVMEQGYQLADHEGQLEAINESVSNIEKSLEHDFIYADRWDEIQNEFYHLNRIVDDLRNELRNQTVNKALDNNSIDQMDLVRNIIKPLGEKLHDKTIGYKTTYRKVYIAMNVNWKYRMTRWANLNGCKEQLRKIDLVAQDDKLFELFKVTVAKMLEN